MNSTENDRLLFLRGQVQKLQQFLYENDPINSMSGDGVSASIDRTSILNEIDRYRREIAVLEGTRPTLTTLDWF